MAWLKCGEVYLGDQTPDRCPFCGAAGRQMVSAAEWIDYGKVDMDDFDMEQCRTALGFEVSNATFYRCCAGKAENIFNQVPGSASVSSLLSPQWYSLSARQSFMQNTVYVPCHQCAAPSVDDRWYPEGAVHLTTLASPS